MNNLDLIDKLVYISDIARERLNESWDFTWIEKVDKFEKDIIEFLNK